MSAIFRNGHIYASAQALPIDADDVRYDNTETGLESTDAQGALDELYELVQEAGGTDTTYTLSVGTGDDVNKIILTPSTGTADKITVPYATVAGDANTVNGKTVGVNVPANAVFTDNNTTYTLSVGTGEDANKIILTPSSGDVIKITVPYASNSGTVNGKTVAESVPSGAVFTDTTYTLTQSQQDGHILTFTPSSGSPTTITIPDNNTTYDNLNQFSNADTKFITNAVNDLTNYYKKTETYTQSEVNALISAIPKFSIEVVDSLLIPDPSPTTIYLLLNSTTSTQNLYTEYIYIIPDEGEPYFEKLGEQTVDLSNYYTSAQVDTLLSAKADSSSLGTAASKGVDTSISDASTSVNLPTSGAVAAFVEGKGYVTTDTNTTYSLSVGTGDDSTKIVLTPSSGAAEKITVPYATDAGTVNGKTVGVNVPSDAVFTDTDTTYDLSVGTGDDVNKIILTPSSGTANKITVPYASDAGTVNGKTVAVNVPADAVFTDTTYESKTAASGGTDVSLVTTGEKYTWNNKSDFSGSYNDLSDQPTLGSAAEKDVASSGDASSTQVVMGNDSRLTDSRNAADVYSWAKAENKPSYTASEVGAIATSAKGAASGVAELDANGKVPSAQLPSYVDDIIEGYLYNGKFYEDVSHTTEITGETGKIYVDLSTEKTYRWSGTAYVEISESLALGTTSSTAFRGDYGNTAYTHATDSSRLTTAQTSGLYKIATTAEGHVASVTAVQKSDITDLGIPGSDTNTTYTLSAGSGDDAQKVILTSSSGDAQKITVPFATNASDAQTVKGNAVPVEFKGTTAQWNALTTDQKKTYDNVILTDDYDAPTTMDASDVTYSNTTSGLSSTTVQGAIDELSEDDNSFIGTTTEWSQLTTAEKIEYDMAVFTNDYDAPANPSASNVNYSNTTSGLVATNVQSAIDEVAADTSKDFEGTTAQWNNLTTAQKKEYDRAMITDDYELPDHMAANEITYNNSSSGISASNVQDAIDAVNTKVNTKGSGTVTSVGITAAAGSGIGVSGSPITSSGSIALTNNGVRSISCGNARGGIQVNTGGSYSEINLTGVYFGIDEQQDPSTWPTPTINDTGTIHVYTTTPIYPSWYAGDRLILFLYNQYQNTTDSQQQSYELLLSFNDDSQTIYPVFYTGEDGNMRPVIFDAAKTVKLIPGKAYTLTFTRDYFNGDFFIIDDLFISPTAFIGTTAQWNALNTTGNKTLYDVAYITND